MPGYGDFMFTDCSSLVGGAGFTYKEDCTDYRFAVIDGFEGSEGYFTGAEQTLPGTLLYSYDVTVKNGNIPYKGQDSVLEVPWQEGTLPDNEHEATTETSWTYTIDDKVTPTMENPAIGEFKGAYKVYSASSVIGKLIEEYGLAEFFERYGVEFSFDGEAKIVQAGQDIVLDSANTYAWIEPVVNYYQSFVLSFYGGLYPDAANVPEMLRETSAAQSKTFTIPSGIDNIPRAANAQFIY